MSNPVREIPAMANLIIGYTTHESTTIWIRGEEKYPFARVSLYSRNQEIPYPNDTIKLSEEKDYTEVVPFVKLKSDTEYGVWACFTPTEEQLSKPGAAPQCQGRFRTFPDPETYKEDPSGAFSFLLGSCNLSNFTINSFLALLLGLGGMYAMTRSLERSSNTWDMDFPDTLDMDFENWFMRYIIKPLYPYGVKWILKTCPNFFGCLSNKAISLGGWFTKNATKGKQPGQPMLKSPFLKLSALFDNVLIVFISGENEPAIGDTLTGNASGATGVLAFLPVLESGTWGEKNAVGKLVMTDVRGKYEPGESLRVGDKAIGRVKDNARKIDFKYKRPAFIMHAGDQIYFDFPYRNRRPKLKEYRRTYRETWFEDDSIRNFLARYPNFMTLDDHEIFDQFAINQPTPLEGKNGKKGEATDEKKESEYFKYAIQSYREYVHSRQNNNGTNLYYEFQYGKIFFFMLDTRSTRILEKKDREGKIISKGEMISENQMRDFQCWLIKHQNDLKFVVSSVPFIAEIGDKEISPETADSGAPLPMKAGKNSSSNQTSKENDDKWSGPSFKAQREEIIQYIYNNDIKRLVFLVGDLHCTYHATMHLGDKRKYECKIIHELAGGPFHQLQMGNLQDFAKPVERSVAVSRDGKKSMVPYKTRMERFYSGANAVMHITVDYPIKRGVDFEKLPREPEIEWKVIRTMTDPVPANNGKLLKESPAMSGRIRFIERAPVGKPQP